MVAELDPLLPLGVVARTVGVCDDTVRRWMDVGLRGVGKLRRPRGYLRRMVYLSELRRFLAEAERVRGLADDDDGPARPVIGKPEPPHVQAAQRRKAEDFVRPGRGGKK